MLVTGSNPTLALVAKTISITAMFLPTA